MLQPAWLCCSATVHITSPSVTDETWHVWPQPMKHRSLLSAWDILLTCSLPRGSRLRAWEAPPSGLVRTYMHSRHAHIYRPCIQNNYPCNGIVCQMVSPRNGTGTMTDPCGTVHFNLWSFSHLVFIYFNMKEVDPCLIQLTLELAQSSDSRMKYRGHLVTSGDANPIC